MPIYEKLRSLTISLPRATAAIAAYVPITRSGNLLFLSGHIAKKNGQAWKGQLGVDMATEEGKEAARSVAVDLLGTLHAGIGDLNKIERIVKLTVFVNSAPAFTEQHLVANGASELFGEIFGAGGQHARSAMGVAQLPLGSCVEIELVAEAHE